MRLEDLSLRDFTSKSVSSLGEDDFVVFSCGFGGRDDKFETATDAGILIDREKDSVDSSYFFDNLYAKFFILKALGTALEFGLFVIVDDDPNLVGSCLRAGEFKALDVSWVDRIEIS